MRIKNGSSLTNQVCSISEMTKAVAHGNLSKVVDVDVQGEMLDLKETVNSMVAQYLSSLANDFIRVSIEVGTEGKLGGQAVVPDVKGVWKVGDSILISHAYRLIWDLCYSECRA